MQTRYQSSMQHGMTGPEVAVTDNGTFLLLTQSDTRTVVGKAWWNSSHVLSIWGDQRRKLMQVGVGGVAGLVGLAALPSVVGAFSDDDDTRREQRPALALQQQFGWSFGVADEAKKLTFPGGMTDPNLAAKLPLLTSDLAPKNAALTPFAVTTLFDSLRARPAAPANTEDERGQSFVALQDVIMPITTEGMSTAGNAGAMIAACTKAADVAVIIDLPGPNAVACATAMAGHFDPVFLFDNWPHPRGVVPAHLTLAAALSQQPLLAAAKQSRPTGAPPMFVLDRNRLNPYLDEQQQFDNRSLARLPSVEALQRLGIRKVFYVTELVDTTIDADDVNDDLVAYQAGGLTVRAVDVALLAASPTTEIGAAVCQAQLAGVSAPAAMWRPVARVSAFSAGSGQVAHPRPPNFAHVPVVMNIATGAMVGALLYRSGSWNRSSSWSFGGG
jgi:hypothetical protein